MDNVIQLDMLRIDRNKPRKCTCDERKKKFMIDTVNREVTCECGMTVDPFEAIVYLGKYYERINEQQERMNEQRAQWKKEKPYSVLFKELERHYRRGEMMPNCPACQSAFDFKHISFWSNKMFFRPSYLDRP